MVKDKHKETVRQKDADELHATITLSPSSVVTVEQSDPSKLKATVTQAEKDRTITGNVGILDSADVRINPSKEDGNLSTIAGDTTSLDGKIPSDPAREGGNLASILTQLDITLSAFRDALRGANTKDFSTIQTLLESIKDTDGIKKITDSVTVIATNLDIRDLTKAQDEVYTVLRTDAGVAYDARDRSWTIIETVPVSGTFWQVTQPVSATDLDIRDLVKTQDEVYAVLRTDAGVAYDARDRSWTITETLTVTNISDIKTAVEKIDNQEDSIPYVTIQKQTADGNILAAPGAGNKLRVHHLYVNNEGANVTVFEIEDGTTPKWRYCLAASGGGYAQNLKRPWDLAENSALYYDYKSGAFAIINITVGYETVAV